MVTLCFFGLWNLNILCLFSEFTHDWFVLQQQKQTISSDYDWFVLFKYIQISKKQLELVKNLKQNGEGIPPKSLHRVLGDIKDLVVEPYEVYEEGEKKKLHDLWLVFLKASVVIMCSYFDYWNFILACTGQDWLMKMCQKLLMNGKIGNYRGRNGADI